MAILARLWRRDRPTGRHRLRGRREPLRLDRPPTRHSLDERIDATITDADWYGEAAA